MESLVLAAIIMIGLGFAAVFWLAGAALLFLAIVCFAELLIDMNRPMFGHF